MPSFNIAQISLFLRTKSKNVIRPQQQQQQQHQPLGNNVVPKCCLTATMVHNSNNNHKNCRTTTTGFSPATTIKSLLHQQQQPPKRGAAPSAAVAPGWWPVHNHHHHHHHHQQHQNQQQHLVAAPSKTGAIPAAGNVGGKPLAIAMMMARRTAQPTKPPKLTIFDKDGTLICFNAMWIPWAKMFANRLCDATPQLDLRQKIFTLLGYCPVVGEIRCGGLLAEGTMAQIHVNAANLMVQHGVDRRWADKIVGTSLHECNSGGVHRGRAKEFRNLRNLFRALKTNGVRIAICTADNRAGTLNTLKQLGLEQYLDIVICGDDVDSKPKPNPHNATQICRALGVHPKEALVVGDTLADIGMGKNANVGTTVAVLSGVGNRQELSKSADHLINDVGDLLPLFFSQNGITKKSIIPMGAETTGRERIVELAAQTTEEHGRRP